MLNDDLREENLKLRAENRRLCAALQKISGMIPSDNDFPKMCGIMMYTADVALSELLPGTHHDIV